MKRGLINLQTRRLILRPITLDDVQGLYELNLNPEVTQYTGDIAFESIEATEKFYKAYDQYQRFGMGRFSTFLKSNNEFIGWCGLKKIENGVIDLGYRFFKKHWGYGYATEASLVCLRYGFENLNLSEIIAQAWTVNSPSIRVMQKIGMEVKQEFMYEGRPAIQYYMTQELYQSKIKGTPKT